MVRASKEVSEYINNLPENKKR